MPASCAAYSADASALCRAGCVFDENHGVSIPGGEELTEIPINISGARASGELVMLEIRSGAFPFVFRARSCGIRCRSWSRSSKPRPRWLLPDVGVQQGQNAIAVSSSAWTGSVPAFPSGRWRNFSAFCTQIWHCSAEEEDEWRLIRMFLEPWEHHL